MGGIVPHELWDQVLALLAANRVNRRHQVNAAECSLLAGMIRDGEGRRMTPSHASRRSLRYRNYVSVDEAPEHTTSAMRLPAVDLERGVLEGLAALLSQRNRLVLLFEHHALRASQIDALLKRANSLQASLGDMPRSRARELLLALRLEVIVHEDRIEAHVDPQSFGTSLGLEAITSDAEDPIPLQFRTMIVRRGTSIKMLILPDESQSSRRPDPGLVNLISDAHAAKAILGLDGNGGEEYSQRNGLARSA